MRPLLIDDNIKKAVQELVKFASREENWYKIGESKWVPGDRQEYILHMDTYRCVFTNTLMEDKRIFRHLSVSIPKEDMFPNPVVVYEIASMFGFIGAKTSQLQSDIVVGPGDDWLLNASMTENCSVVAQKIT